MADPWAQYDIETGRTPPSEAAPEQPQLSTRGDFYDLSSQYGIDPNQFARIAQIESSGNPRAQTGSYKGLFQMSDSEFNRYGGGNIFDPYDNAHAAARKMQAEAQDFNQRFGRAPDPTEFYLIHQQGMGGLSAHLANPDQPAWQSMYSTGEGRQKGAGWARQAIWGNVPDNYKRQFGSVDNVSSQDFINMWRQKVEGGARPTPTVMAFAGEEARAPGITAIQNQTRNDPWAQYDAQAPTSVAAQTGTTSQPQAQPTPSMDPWAQYDTSAPPTTVAQAAPSPSVSVPTEAGAPRDPWAIYERPIAQVGAPAPEAPAPTETSAAPEPPTPDVAKWSALPRGLIAGTIGTNPKTTGSAIEATGVLTDSPWLQSTGKSIADYGEAQLKQYAPDVPSYRDITGLGTAASYAGYNLGSGIGSSLPSAVTGLAGALVTANPIAGIAIGAFGPSYIQNFGDAYSSAKEDPDIAGMLQRGELTPKQVAGVSAIAGVPMGVLDSIGEGKILGGALNEAKRGLIRGLAKAMVKGSIIEGSTEGLQEAISQWSRQYLGSNEPLQKRVDAIVDNVLGGAIPGGVMGGGAKLLTRPAPTPADVERERQKTMTQLTNVLSSMPPTTTTPEGEKIPQPLNPEVAATTVPTEPQVPPGAPAPATPPEILQTETPETIFADVKQETAPVFYSQLLRATEKLPDSGSSEQMLATLRNQPGVKQSEIDDTGLETWVKSQPGKINKEDLVSYLESNGVRVEETYNSGKARWKLSPSYSENVAPGPWQSYMEMRLTAPVKEGVAPYVSGHWPEPNVIAHVRATTRIDSAGNPMLHIEEIQSDVHQAGQKYGYLTADESRRLQEINRRHSELRMALDETASGINNTQAEYKAARAAGAMSSVLAEINRRSGQLVLRNEALNREREAIVREATNIRYGELEPGVSKLRPKVPDLPFKSDWVELAVKRMFRWAADNGYEKISWQSPMNAILHNTGARGDISQVSPRIQQGLTEFYGRILPSRMKKVAKKYGGVVGVDSVPAPGFMYDVNPMMVDTYHVTVPPAARTMVQRGVPLYDKPPVGPARATVQYGPAVAKLVGPEFLRAVKQVTGFFEDYAKKFGFNNNLKIHVTTGPMMVGGQIYTNVNGLAWRNSDGTYGIFIDPMKFNGNIAQFYTTFAHELGHVIVFEHFHNLPDATKLLIKGEFADWRRAALATGRYTEALRMRRPAPRQWMEETAFTRGLKITDLSQDTYDYHFGDYEGFHEYMADQIARWFTTQREPLTVVEKAWKGIANALKQFTDWMAHRLGLEVRPTLAVTNWLNSFISQAAPIGAQEYAATDIRTQKVNSALVDPVDDNVFVPPQQQATQPTRGATSQAFSGNVPPVVNQAAVHADRINFIYKYFASLLDLGAANKLFTPLQNYIEKSKAMHRETMQILDATTMIAKRWRKLGRQSENLVQYMDELTNMTYLTPQEKARGVSRKPTIQEDLALRQRIGLSPEAKGVADNVMTFFDTFLDLVSQNAIAEAMSKLAGQPVLMAQKIAEIQGQVAQLKSRPYFPFMRFGRHFVLVKDQNGRTLHFETFEAVGPFKMQRAQRKQRAKAEEMRGLYPNATVTESMLPESAEPFVGLPTTMLQHIAEKMQLTPDQLDALRQLQFQLSPSMSFRHHFQHKSYVPGYSRDFLRAFSRYAFFGARYYAHTKYVNALRQDVRDARLVSDNKAARIADFMSDHLEKTLLDVKGDYGFFKGLTFFWALGYVPSAATQNMSQVPMVSFPFLSSKFGPVGIGDLRASGAIMRAMLNMRNFYRKGTYSKMTNSPTVEFEMKALNYGVKTGRITEAQASELAGLAQGGNLWWGTAGNPAQRTIAHFYEKSAWMFEMAEQWNRRITFRAALDLAMAHNGAKFVNESVAKNQVEYRQLTQAEGFTPQQARAVIAANEATEQTQFVYARYGRARFSRGRLSGTIFIFKHYLRSLMFLGINNPSFLMRYVLIMALMGGMGGIPGYEDLKSILNGVARALGFNFDLEKMVRRYILDHTDGSVPPDMVLHGLARRGFGIPAALDMLGGLWTGRPGRGFDMSQTKQNVNIPYPTFDRSKAITPGPLLPIDVSALLDPSKDRSKAIADQGQKAAGAAFGVAFNLYKFLFDDKNAITDQKRWERAIPRELAALSKMYRTYTEGRERTMGGPNAGSTVINYDVRDTEQLMEVIGLGLGYNNIRASGKWDMIMAEADHEKYVQFERNGLLAEFNEARKGGIPEEIDKVREKIVEFNDKVRGTEDRAQVITPDTIKRSVMARERAVAAREIGVPTQKGKIPIAQEYQRLFPEATVDVRRVGR